VKQPVHPLLDEEALRVIRIMPRWFPAMTPKEPVRVKYTVPITFKL
jgi:protein TonB